MAKSRYPLKLYLTHLPNALMLGASALTNIAIWVWLLWYIRPQSELIFLHYNVLFGVDLIGPWYQVLSIPIIGVCILLVNAGLGWFFFGKDKFIAYIMNAVTVLAHVFLGIAALLLVFLNV
jgi:hypothetical protein